MRMLLGLVAGLIGGVVVGACAKDTAEPAGPGAPGAVACTEIGCLDGARITLEKATPWAAGEYTFVFDLDGAAVTCKGSLPLKQCDAGPTLSCDVADKVQVGESGCALPPESHGFSDVQIKGAPKSVAVKISNGGQTVHEVELAPKYTTSRPNGEGCEPECHGASEIVKLQ